MKFDGVEQKGNTVILTQNGVPVTNLLVRGSWRSCEEQLLQVRRDARGVRPRWKNGTLLNQEQAVDEGFQTEMEVA